MRRILIPLAGVVALAAPSAKPDAQADRLFRDYWEHQLRTGPELATAVGDPRYNHRLSDTSPAAIQRDLAWKRRFLANLGALDAKGLDEGHRLSVELLSIALKEELDGARFRPWELALSQMNGLHLDFPQLFSSHPFRTAKDYRDYLARLRAFPKAMEGTLGCLRDGLASGRMPPRLVVEAVIAQVKALCGGASAEAPFLEPMKVLPAAIPPVVQASLRRRVAEALTKDVTPAYRRLLRFLERDYLPKSRATLGTSALPDGEAFYRWCILRGTTLELDPRAVHETGLKEVARIEAEMAAIATAQGFKDLAAFKAHVDGRADLHPRNGAELVARYQGYVDGMRPMLPRLFGRLPKAPLVVVPMEDFRAEGAAGADYVTGTPDGTRPGRFNVNTFKAESRSMLSCESTAYHEALPGHHLQLSIAQELEGVPEFRKHLGLNAYDEGWALYSERLPKELGFYKDPISDYGRLNDEMLRAIRLVLDTGVHQMGWTREQMVAFFRAHGSSDEVDIQSETDRYIAWPGQALGYKIGQLKILELRDRAKARMGDRFDLRAFHDLVLDGGAMPLTVLERRVEEWSAPQAR